MNQQSSIKVCILGLGYIGLPTASVLAANGFEVIGVDINKEHVFKILHGSFVTYEPNLADILDSVLRSKRLRVQEVPSEADVYIICVPTPFKDGHKPDLSYVEKAVSSIAPFLCKGNLIILESTVPVGTTEKMASLLANMRKDLCTGKGQDGMVDSVSVVHCPERVLPGHIIHELIENDRIVGGIDQESTRKGVNFYRCFVKGDVQATDSRTAEMIKLAENSFRDVNIAFANELSLLCHELKLNVWDVIEFANRHPRVNILNPGAGVGGHCIAVDPWFLVDASPRTARLIQTAREVNDAKPRHIIERTLAAAGRFEHPVVACLGLAFKPDVDDMRGSPALTIAEAVACTGIDLVVCEPHIETLPPSLLNRPNVKKMGLRACLQTGNIILALVGHTAFSSIEKAWLARKTLIDACGLWRKNGAISCG